jgi:hypothetical protein
MFSYLLEYEKFEFYDINKIRMMVMRTSMLLPSSIEEVGELISKKRYDSLSPFDDKFKCAKDVIPFDARFKCPQRCDS